MGKQNTYVCLQLKESLKSLGPRSTIVHIVKLCRTKRSQILSEVILQRLIPKGVHFNFIYIVEAVSDIARNIVCKGVYAQEMSANAENIQRQGPVISWIGPEICVKW